MKKASWFIWLVLVSIAVFFFSDNMVSRQKLKIIEKQYREYKTISELSIKMRERDIQAREEKIAELNGAIDSANTVIISLEKKAEESDKELTEIRKTWGALTIECRTKLEELDSAWSRKFSLAINEITELREIGKLKDLKISELYGIIDSKNDIITEKDKQIVSCEKAAAEVSKLYLREKTASRLKTWLGAGLVATGFVLGKL